MDAAFDRLVSSPSINLFLQAVRADPETVEKTD